MHVVLIFVVAVVSAGCGGCGDDSPDLTASGNVTEKNQNSQINCACRLFMEESCSCRASDTEAHFLECLAPIPGYEYPLADHVDVTFPACLPAELNMLAPGGGFAGSDAEWSTKVNDFCTTTLGDTSKKLFNFLTKGGCEHLCVARVQCVQQEFGPSMRAAQSNTTCGATCEPIDCDYDAPDRKCNFDQVIDQSTNPATVHIDKCKCTRLPVPGWGTTCGFTEPSEVFCLKPPGNKDPPTIASGMLTGRLAAPNEIAIDRDQSFADVTIEFEGGAGEDHSNRQVFKIAGAVTLNGLCAPGSSCDMLLDMDLFAEPATFHFSDIVCGPTCLTDANVALSKIGLNGGTADVLVHIDANGFGTIPVNTLDLRAEARLDGIPDKPPTTYTYQKKNDIPIAFRADFGNKTFAINGVPFDFASGHGSLSVTGKIVNQPPRAKAGADQTLECTSPTGATATLDGSASSDPDGDIFSFNWWKGPGAFFTGESVGEFSVVTTQVPFTPPKSTTTYALTLFDSRMAISSARTNITVQDTTAPSVEVTATPSCLWPPNHGLVLYELGNGLSTEVKDLCDAAPKLRIVSVTSDQPATGGGSGNTTPDVLFGDTALCIRSERAGTISSPRTYTVTVEAKDSSGNVSTKQVKVAVRHDQTDPKCANVAPKRIVEDGDPRCTSSGK